MKILKKILFILFGVFVSVACLDCPFNNNDSNLAVPMKMLPNVNSETLIEHNDKRSNSDILEEGIANLQNDYNLCQDETTKGKLLALIETAQSLLRNDRMFTDHREGQANLRTDISLTAIASYFVLHNYLLAEELFLHSIDENTIEDEVYVPVYGSRISSSNIIENIAFSSGLSGTDTFNPSDGDGSLLKNDLHYSINEFSWRKNYASSRVVYLTDKYDFEHHDHQYDDFVEMGVDLCIDAHARNELKYYYVDINVDMSNVLVPTIVSSTNSSVTLQILNRTTEDRTVIFNSSTVLESDAIYRRNLCNLDYIQISSNDFETFTINTNTDNDFCVFSFVSNTLTHYSTIIRIYGESDLNVEYYFYESIQVYQGYNILNLGKSGSSWVIYVKNTTAKTKKIQYNSRMCTGNDAINWTNLTDVVTSYVYPSSDFIFNVSEYGFSTHIAVRTFSSTAENRYWINNLSTTTSLSIGTSSYDFYPYLMLSIVNKVGSTWTICVTNQTQEGLYFSYNSKMCFKNDGLNWTLSDVVNNVYVSANGSTNIYISENWFADSIAVSFVNINNTRLISVGYRLNASNNSLAVENNHL